MDCMQGMKEFPDKYFDLAIVDPPFGGGNPMNGKRKSEADLEGGSTNIILTVGTIPSSNCCRTGGTWAKKYQTNGNAELKQDIRHWDIAPSEEYFEELFRVSKNQIIWGGNYFDLPQTRCFIVWDKKNISEDFSMAMCEYAWCSFNGNAKMFRHIPQGNTNENRMHPTQKPVALYEWLLNKYAKPNDIILDTHVGSASSLIACYNTNHKFVGFELDEYYYKISKQRLDAEMAQMRLSDFMGDTV